MDDISSIVSFKSGGSDSVSQAAPVVEKVDAPALETPEPKGDSPKGEVAAPPAALERDETGKFKAKVEPEAKAEPAAEVKPPQKDSVSAIIAMRTRLQAAENRVRELEASGQTKVDKPDIFTDPDRVVADLVSQQVRPIREKFFKQSLANATKAYDDFEDAAAYFSEMLEGNPALVKQLTEHEDPGEFIYQVGSNTPEYREAQSLKVRETLSAKDSEIAALKAQLAAATNAQKAVSEVPDSLNRQPSGAVPERDSDSDINKIVRFKSG